MFEFIQRHNKIFQVLLFLLIVPSFVVVGLDGYNRMRDNGEAVATVSGTPITANEFQAAHKAEVDRVRRTNPDMDLKVFDTEAFKKSTLDRLILQKVQALAAKDSRFVVSDAALAKALASDPNIVALIGPDGKVDTKRYEALLASNGLTPEQYEARARSDMSSQQVFQPLAASGLNTPSVGALVTQAFLQKREIQVLNIKPSEFAAQVKPTDADVQAYYKSHESQFQLPEQATIEYLVLDIAAIKAGLVVTDKQLQEYYDNNVARLSGNEERRASHILIAAGKSASATEREAAKAKATALQAQLVKAPDTFAQVAKANSQDPGSAANGGDLNFFSRGAMTKSFEDAAFALKVGEISSVVETEFGFHIIKVTEIKKPKSKTFEELKPEMETAIRQQLAQQKYAELAEQFSNAVYEQADALKGVADKFKLTLQTATLVGRQAPAGTKGPLANPKFLSTIFAADSLNNKRNTEAVEVGPSQLASARVTQYMAAKAAPFAEVKDKAQALLVQSRSEELAKAEGAKKLAEFKSASDGSKLPPAIVVSRDKPENQSGKILDAALSVDPAQLPATVGVDLGAQGYAVVRVNKVLADAPEATLAQRLSAQVSQAWAASEAQAYFDMLKARYKVEINAKALAPAAAEKK
jgi:peptidyl-prolyl cis-trans isomerase D